MPYSVVEYTVTFVCIYHVFEVDLMCDSVSVLLLKTNYFR